MREGLSILVKYEKYDDLVFVDFMNKRVSVIMVVWGKWVSVINFEVIFFDNIFVLR